MTRLCPLRGMVCYVVGLALLGGFPTLALAQTENSGVTQEKAASELSEETFETPRGIGMGMGGRAGAIGTSALAYNPANLALAQLYHVDVTSGFIASEGAWTLGTAVVDSFTSKLAAGTSFRGVFDGGVRQYRGWDWRVGVGASLAKFIYIGTSLRYSKLKGQKNKAGERIGPRLEALTMDTALTLVPFEKIRMSGFAYNLIQTHSILAPREVGGGVSLLVLPELDFAFDFLADLSTFTGTEYKFGGGIEYLIAGAAVVRSGYKRDLGRNTHLVGGSIGYTSKSFGLESAVQRVLDGKNSETRVLFSARYHVH